MFSLVQYSDDIYHIVRTKLLKKKNSVDRAPYKGIMYDCIVLVTHDDDMTLKHLQRNLQEQYPKLMLHRINHINDFDYDLRDSFKYENNLTQLSHLYKSSEESDNSNISIRSEMITSIGPKIIDDRILTTDNCILPGLPQFMSTFNSTQDDLENMDFITDQTVDGSASKNIEINSSVVLNYSESNHLNLDHYIHHERESKDESKYEMTFSLDQDQSRNHNFPHDHNQLELKSKDNSKYETKSIFHRNDFENNNGPESQIEYGKKSNYELKCKINSTSGQKNVADENLSDNMNKISKSFNEKSNRENFSFDETRPNTDERKHSVNTNKKLIKSSNISAPENIESHKIPVKRKFVDEVNCSTPTAKKMKTCSTFDATTIKSDTSRDNKETYEKNDLKNTIEKMKPANLKPLGKALANPKESVISNSKSSKKYYCPYCKTKTWLSGKLIDHLLSVHRNLPDIREIALLPEAKKIKGVRLNELQLKRLDLIAEIRNWGAFMINCSTDRGDEIQVARRPQVSLTKTVDEFRICPYCYGGYAKDSIRKHFKICRNAPDAPVRGSTKAMHNYIIGNIHSEATIYLRLVATRLRADNITSAALNDFLIVIFGNFEAFKFRNSTHHNRQIRAELRLLARFLLTMKEKSETVIDLSSILVPIHSKKSIEVANELGNYDIKTKVFKTPATARDIGRLLTKVCKIWIDECIDRDLPDLQKKAENYLHLHTNRFPVFISKTVSESQTHKEISSGLPGMPSRSDIKKLSDYVRKLRDEAYSKLQEGFNYNYWLQLGQTTLISILVFNRKRPGEVSRLLKLTFENCRQSLIDDKYKDFYEKITKEAMQLAQKYIRILIRGKKNAKIVPLLLTNMMLKCLELFLEMRELAGVSKDNPYVFGLPSKPDEHKFIEGSALLAKFSDKCGANIPTTLRGTLLRKHIASVGIALELTNNQVEDLSTFMGHDSEIHKNIYRQPVGSQDILQVSQWLEYAQGDFIETASGNLAVEEGSLSDDEADDCLGEDSHNNDEDKNRNDLQGSIVVAKQSHNSDEVEKERMNWTTEATRIIVQYFGQKQIDGKKISNSEITNVLSKYKTIFPTQRTAAQIRSHLQYLQKKEKLKNLLEDYKSKNMLDVLDGENDSSPDKMKRPRNRIPDSIFRHFSYQIENQVEVTREEILQVYTKSPNSFDKYTPQQIKKFIDEAYECEKSF